jgi:glutamyl-tRNA reductase
MTHLVIGASHHSASVGVLERLAVNSDGAAKLALAALESPHVAEAIVIATCNRVEIYAEVDRFHGSVEDLTALLVEMSQLDPERVLAAVYVHYDDAAVAHLFTVATGLDSMVVGEAQILGQVKDALNRGQRDDTVGPVLNSLFQQALRVGKRAHAETGIDTAGQSLVSVALDAAEAELGSLADARVCIVGAGSLAAFAVATVRRRGARNVTVASRSRAKAQLLAESVSGTGSSLEHLVDCLRDADLVVSCTGASEAVLSAEDVGAVVRGRSSPLLLLDLALPHDIEPAAGDLPGVRLIGFPELATLAPQQVKLDDVAAVQTLVADEVAAFGLARSAARVAPTVVALRSLATGVVADELDRLWTRCGDLTAEQRSEVTTTVRRVADKLLHSPTVRIKQLADQAPSASYADALAELFALDPATVKAVTTTGERP